MRWSPDGSTVRHPTRSSEGALLYPIQALRAVAAFAVCLAHVLHETDIFPGNAALYAFGESGPLPAGVDLFFLISGFIMLYTARSEFGRPGAPQRFMLRRVTRIVPLYWLFTILMIAATLLFPERLTKTAFDLKWAIASFAFFPTIGLDGDVGPILALGWSLEYEMYFYLVFALGLTWREGTGLRLVVTLIGGIWLIANLLPPVEIGVLRFLANPVVFEFLLGMAFARCWLDVSGRRRVAMYGAWLVTTLAAYVILEPLVNHRLVDWGLPCLLLLVTVMGLADLLGSRWCRPLHIFGDASYALYLSHPFTIELLKWLVSKIVPTIHAVPFVFIGLVVAHLVGILIYRLLERPTLALLRTRFPQSQVTPAPLRRQLGEAVSPASVPVPSVTTKW